MCMSPRAITLGTSGYFPYKPPWLNQTLSEELPPSGLSSGNRDNWWPQGGTWGHQEEQAQVVIFAPEPFFYCYSVTIVCIFSPSLHPIPANPTSLPHLYLPPWFCPCVLYSSSCNPLSSLSPPHSPLAIVKLFLISMSLVIFCLLFSFVDYVPVKGEIIWYLSLTAWLVSLSMREQALLIYAV